MPTIVNLQEIWIILQLLVSNIISDLDKIFERK